jgi:Spy/CpxP family protein refolding chaperone
MRKLTLATAALLLFAGAAMAQPPEGNMPGHGMMGHGPMWMGDGGAGPMMGCLKGIELTDDQRGKLDKMHLDQARKMVERGGTMADLHSKLKLAITADKFSQKDVDDIATKIGKFHQEQISMHAAMMRAVRDLLTPDQRIKFDQNVLTMGRMGMGKRMGQGMGPGMKCGMGLGMGQGMGKCGPGGCDMKMGRDKEDDD